MSRVQICLLLSIVFLGFALRFYNVGELPNGLTWDEAAIGYNAWSVSKNLRDEHGEFLPLVFKSFGDFKPPVYIYMTAPFVAALGLGELSTRLLSVLSGTIAIFLIYLLVKEMSNNSKWAILSSLFLAVSPWHIFYSRGAWETNLMTTFLILGIWGLIRSSHKKSGLWWGLTSLFMAMMTYQAGKLYVPLLLLVFFVTNTVSLKETLSQRKSMVIWGLFGTLSGLLLGLNIFTSAGNRLNRLSIFNYRPDLREENKKYDDQSSQFHNTVDFRVRLVASRYLTHFSTDFLFIDNKPTDRGHLPKMGMMYWLDAAFLVVGLLAVVGLKDGKTRSLILWMLAISAIPGALTLAEFSSTRNLFMIVPLSIVGALGIARIFENGKIWLVVIVPLWIFCVVYFWDIFTVHSGVVFGKEFNIGYKKVFETMDRTKPSRAVITDVYGQPYIYYLFYGKVDPVWYQKQREYRERGIDVGLVGRVGEVEFRQFDYAEIKRSTNTFFAGGVGNYIGGNTDELETVEYLDDVKVDGQEVMFRILKTK